MMSSSEFSQLAREYQASLNKDFIEKKQNQDEGGEGMKKAASATFEGYDSLYNKMKQQVQGNLTNLKTRKTSKISATLAKNQAKKIRQIETDDDEDEIADNNLDWEEDTASDTCSSDKEELVEFRTDLDIAFKKSDPIPFQSLSENMNTPTSTLTAHELDDHFQKELSKASILADFQERYILSTLEKKRQGIPVDGGLEARRLWQETVDANPLVALENISRSLLSGGFEHQEPQSTSSIRELASVDQGIPLSRASQNFAQFIPSAAPVLDFDSSLFDKIKKL